MARYGYLILVVLGFAAAIRAGLLRADGADGSLVWFLAALVLLFIGELGRRATKPTTNENRPSKRL